MKLYASQHGGRYHRDDQCGLVLPPNPQPHLLRRWPPVTRAEARERGLTPCRVCKPPVLLEVIEGGGNPAADPW